MTDVGRFVTSRKVSGTSGFDDAQIKGVRTFALIAGAMNALAFAFHTLSFAFGQLESAQFAVELGEALVQIGAAVATWTLAPRSDERIRLGAVSVLFGVLVVFSGYYDVIHLQEIEFILRPSWICLAVLFFGTLIPASVSLHAVLALLTVLFIPVGASIAAGFGLYDHLSDASWYTEALKATVPVALCATVSVIVASRQLSFWNRVKRLRDEYSRIGSYILEEKLGVGGMGEVWRAQHALLARPAAVKLIKPVLRTVDEDDSTRQTRLARFEREARLTAALTSNHVVRLYDFGVTDDGEVYYAMELLSGQDLRMLVERHGRMVQERVHFLILQICDALEEAHSVGLIHRDIKPANIVLTREGGDYDVAKLLDFGLALDTEECQSGERLTQDGKITGSPLTMAPEQVLGEKLDARADIYALGCTAYYMLAGHHVFDAPSPREMMLRHVKDEPVPLSDFLAIEPEFDALIMRCLAKTPQERPASIEEVVEALSWVRFSNRWTNLRARDWYDSHAR